MAGRNRARKGSLYSQMKNNRNRSRKNKNKNKILK